MATLAVYNAQKEKVDELVVSDAIFSVTPKEGILHEVVRWQMAKRRSGNACTKTRSEVSGGGKKPFRQKGTGNAREGSNTSPVGRRGGVAFGPKPRDYSYSVPKKVRRLALKMALTTKRDGDHLLVLRDFGLDQIKTKDMKALLDRFDIKKTLIIMDIPDRVLELSARNIPYVKILSQKGLNVYDLLKYEHVIVHEAAVRLIEERLQP
ncbi:MAG: 50S ribosomal protein L4 [Nitrospiraceae bacterium]|nr:50S ribosomal protein L4 [Nitrospiraceae bacterium]